MHALKLIIILCSVIFAAHTNAQWTVTSVDRHTEALISSSGMGGSGQFYVGDSASNAIPGAWNSVTDVSPYPEHSPFSRAFQASEVTSDSITLSSNVSGRVSPTGGSTAVGYGQASTRMTVTFTIAATTVIRIEGSLRVLSQESPPRFPSDHLDLYRQGQGPPVFTFGAFPGHAVDFSSQYTLIPGTYTLSGSSSYSARTEIAPINISGYLNFSFAVVPAPASALSLSLGGLVLTRRRRR